MKNIIAYGDSVMKGIVIRDGKYTASSDKFTNIVEAQTGIHIENKGHLGHTILHLEKSIQRSSEVLNDESFDHILLEYGGNDSDFKWNEISSSPDQPHNCKVSIDYFVSEYVRLVNYLKTLGKDVWLMTLPPIDGEKYFQWFSKSLDRDNILCWLDNNPSFLTHWHESYNLAIFKIGNITQTPVVDITTPFFEKKNFTDYLCEDGIHPNEMGQKLIADVLISLVKNEM